MHPTVRKRKDGRGRIISFEASIGSITGNGPDRAHAIQACNIATLEAIDRLNVGTTIGRWRDHVYIVSPSIYGWSYWLDTFNTRYCCEAGIAREEAIANALRHLAQILWSPSECKDDPAYLAGLPEAIRPDLLSYFHWQREYRRLTAAGWNDHDTREIIAGFQKDLSPLSI